MAALRRTLRFALALLALAVACTTPASALSIHAGDLVALDSHLGAVYTRIVRIVPGSGTVDPIAMHGLLDDGLAGSLVVLKDGRVLVSSWSHGLFLVDPADGAQSVLLGIDALGGRPTGLALEPSGTVIALVHSSGTASLIRVDPVDGSKATLTSGSDLVGGGIARGPNGDLFIARANTPPDAGGGSFGSILHVSATGARLATYLSDVFHGPSEVTLTNEGLLYAANWGIMNAGYGGRITRTDAATGLSIVALQLNGCAAVAASPVAGTWYTHMSTLQTGSRYQLEALDGSWSLYDITGPMVVVPAEPVPTHHTTWGSVKRAYR